MLKGLITHYNVSFESFGAMSQQFQVMIVLLGIFSDDHLKSGRKLTALGQCKQWSKSRKLKVRHE